MYKPEQLTLQLHHAVQTKQNICIDIIYIYKYKYPYLFEVAIILVKNFWNLEPDSKALLLRERFFWAHTIHDIYNKVSFLVKI